MRSYKNGSRMLKLESQNKIGKDPIQWVKLYLESPDILQSLWQVYKTFQGFLIWSSKDKIRICWSRQKILIFCLWKLCQMWLKHLFFALSIKSNHWIWLDNSPSIYSKRFHLIRIQKIPIWAKTLACCPVTGLHRIFWHLILRGNFDCLPEL